MLQSSIITQCLFSEDGEQRFYLKRIFSEENKSEKLTGKLVIFMFNPSFANHLLLDKSNTIAINMAIKDRYKELCILNLFSQTSPNKKKIKKKLLKNHENDKYISQELKNADKIIVAWGYDKTYIDRIKNVESLIVKNVLHFKDKVFAVKYTNKKGVVFQPQHLSYYH